MPLTEFNLTDMFSQTWGYSPGPIRIDDPDGGKNVRQTGSGTADLRFTGNNIVNKKSQTGMYGSYYQKDIMGRDVFMPLTLGGLFLPYVWLNIKASKLIVETPMTDRDGEVIEIINNGNYQIGVKGFCIKHDGTFPEKEIEDLRKLWVRKEAVECKSVLTDIFLLTKEHKTDKVVIRDFEIMEAQGIEHVRAFQMSLTSDQILVLELA